MQKELIAGLLAKYWAAETTVEEEKVLADYFMSGVDIPAEWAEYRDLFGFFEVEAREGLDDEFDKRMLERIAGLDEQKPIANVRPMPVLARRGPWWAAAAVIILSLGAAHIISSLADNPPPGSTGGQVAKGTASGDGLTDSSGLSTGVPDGGSKATAMIEDTYDDPQEALAAVRLALGKAGRHINEGRNITKKEFSHFNKINYAINN